MLRFIVDWIIVIWLNRALGDLIQQQTKYYNNNIIIYNYYYDYYYGITTFSTT